MTDDHDRILVLEERLNSYIEARDTQAREYERRMQELNHNHRQQLEAQATYVRRDVYDQFVHDALEWRQHVREQLAVREGGILSMREMLFRIIPLLISVGTVLWLIIRKVL